MYLLPQRYSPLQLLLQLRCWVQGVAVGPNSGNGTQQPQRAQEWLNTHSLVTSESVEALDPQTMTSGVQMPLQAYNAASPLSVLASAAQPGMAHCGPFLGVVGSL